MKRFETIEKIPTWALCYIINGDPTGLSDEDIKMVDGFMQKWQVEIVSPLSQDGNASFSHYPAFYEDPYDRSEEVGEIKNVLQRVFELSGCTCNYHGHIHSKSASDSRCINVSVEHCGFKPIPLRWS